MQCLQELNIKGTVVSMKMYGTIQQLLEKSVSLQVLRLTLYEAGALDDLADGLMLNHSIKTLEVTHFVGSDEHVEKFAAAIANHDKLDGLMLSGDASGCNKLGELFKCKFHCPSGSLKKK